MADVDEVARTLDEVVITATENEDLVQPSAVLDSFTQSLLKYRDPVMREAFLESTLEVLTPHGDERDAGRLAILKDSALTCIPPFLPLVSSFPEKTKAVLKLIAEYADARDVALALNLQLTHFAEQADPYAVSDSDEDSEHEDHGLDWEAAFPQVEEVLDMYTIAIARLKTQRSTPTLLALQDALTPLLQVIPTTAPAGMAEQISRSLLPRVGALVDAAWTWCASTTDSGGEQKAILTELLQMAVMIFGPCLSADLTSRWFLSAFPRFKGLHPESETGPWEGGQDAFNAVLGVISKLGLNRNELLHRITNTSSIKPHSAIASAILLAASLPSLSSVLSEELVLSKTVIADAMPVLTVAMQGSAVDAGTALTWFLINQAQQGQIELEYDQSTFFLEIIMPLIQVDSDPTARLALSKLLGAVIATTPGVKDQAHLFQQLLEPLNPFDGIRVLAISLLREQIVGPPQPSPLLCPALLDYLGPILFEIPAGVLDKPVANILTTMWPVWLAECANLIWFLTERDSTNKSGIAAPAYRAKLRGYLTIVGDKAKKWKAAVSEPEAQLVLDRLEDAVVRARASISA